MTLTTDEALAEVRESICSIWGQLFINEPQRHTNLSIFRASIKVCSSSYSESSIESRFNTAVSVTWMLLRFSRKRIDVDILRLISYSL